MKSFFVALFAFITVVSIPLAVISGIGLWYNPGDQAILVTFVASLLVALTCIYYCYRIPAYREWIIAWLLPF